VAIISITVTESGYRLTPAGDPDPKDGELARDLHLLALPPAGSAAPTTTLGRLLLALNARRLAGAGPIAIVPCDNVPHNGAWLRRGLLTAAARVDPELQEWISQHVSCVTSSVDRITPRATPEAGEVAAAAGWIDQAPVVTEPFRDWTMSGQFPAGRPDWESAGARIVEDVAPYERRKLWLLNGAHTIIAAAGLNRGADTVSAAIADAEVWQQVQALWAEAAGHLPPDVEHRDYRERLHQRFANPRIGHLLAQIATDGSTKVQHRLVPITHAELGAGKAALACATGMAEWIVSVMNAVELHDSQATLLQAAREADDPIAALLTVLDQGLAADGSFAAAVRAHVERIAPLLERQAC
jgi:fructuronate reductase